MEIEFGQVLPARGLTELFLAVKHLDDLRKRFHKKFAWYPIKLSSGRWILGKYYWVRYTGILRNCDGDGVMYMRGQPLELLDSEERLVRGLSEQWQ